MSACIPNKYFEAQMFILLSDYFEFDSKKLSKLNRSHVDISKLNPINRIKIRIIITWL